MITWKINECSINLPLDLNDVDLKLWESVDIDYLKLILTTDLINFIKIGFAKVLIGRGNYSYYYKLATEKLDLTDALLWYEFCLDDWKFIWDSLKDCITKNNINLWDKEEVIMNFLSSNNEWIHLVIGESNI